MKEFTHKLLAVPGPGNIPPEILEVMGQDVIHHRTPDFVETYARVIAKLQRVFETTGRVVVVSTSGTGGMEASVANLFSRGDKVLVVSAGTFGDRYATICRTYGLDVHMLEYPWGQTYEPDDVEAFMAQHTDLKAVLITYNETSTGVLHDVRRIAVMTADTPVLTVVDANSGLIANEFCFDEWGVDCAVGCSQKGFSLPTGLAFIALSTKALEAMEHGNLPRFYFDLRAYITAYEQHGTTPFSPNVSVLRAADLALDRLLERGIERIRRESRDLRAHVAERITEMGLGLLSDDSTCSASGVVVDLMGTVSMKQMKADFDALHNITLSLGKNEYADTHWRIGLLPPMSQEKIDRVLDLASSYVREHQGGTRT